MYDVIIIGGSFAGLSAALQLGRARRKVVVLDTSRPRNRFAAHAHGLLGHDGRPPHEILGEAIAQMRAYPSVRFIQARASLIGGHKDAFAVTTQDGESLAARRVLLAHGIADIMPDIDGFARCWGRSVLHCPYCHGFEVADKRLGLLYFSPMSEHVARMLEDWSGELTVFADGNAIAPEFRARLARRKLHLVEPKVTRLLETDGQLEAVVTEDGAQTGLDALFAGPRQQPAADFHRQLGLAMDDMPLGPLIRVSESHETSMPGLYAAGDVASPRQSAVLAMAAGNLAGVHCHHSLLD